jgi:hypothetical protein
MIVIMVTLQKMKGHRFVPLVMRGFIFQTKIVLNAHLVNYTINNKERIKSTKQKLGLIHVNCVR